MEPPVDWLPPVLMLLAGLIIGVVGAIIVARQGRKGKGTAIASAPAGLSNLRLELRDLEAKRDDLLRQLREMDDTASKREPGQLDEERYAAELATAEVLREIDRLTGKVNAPALARSGSKPGVEEIAEEPAGPAGGIKGFVWGIASAAALGALVIYVSESASDRAEGGSLTGGPQMSGQSAQPASDPELDRAIAVVGAQPENLAARVDLAYQYLLREQFMNVFEQTQLVLERNPNEPRALTYQALVRLAMGQSDVADQMLRRAIEVDPDFLDARVYLALTYAQTGRFDEAMAQMNEAKKRHPDQAARLDDVVAELEMRRSDGATPPVDMGDDPHSSLLPPPPTGDGSAANTPMPAVAAPGSVTGTIVLGDGVLVRSGAPLYLMVRVAGAGGGPPVAVSRMVAGTFPMPFTLSAANSMMGDALPDKMKIEVRVDLDGNAMTRDEGAPEGVVDGVAGGTSGVTITLR